MQLIQQQAAKALAGTNTAQKQAQTTAGGQNVPSDGTDGQTGATADQAGVSDATTQTMDPNLSPENISALLLELQTQQASLDTTLLLGGSTAGPGGKTLVDYLNTSSTANNNGGAAASSDPVSDGMSLVDYLE